MAKAFDSAESKLKDKVYDLRRMEDTVRNEISVRSKAEHRYFERCRENEAIKEKQGVLEKTIGIQREAIAKAKEVESGLHAQLVSLCRLGRSNLERIYHLGPGGL